jgi:hypothetical protein
VERLVSILESFYEREEPRGVAFVGAAFRDITFGRSPEAHLDSLQSIDGFVQLHFEHFWVSVYASNFGRGRWSSYGRSRWLIVQFPLQDDDWPPLGPWNAFVRLAVDVQRCLDGPADAEGPPSAGVPVLKPLFPAPHSRRPSAEAPVPDDPE